MAAIPGAELVFAGSEPTRLFSKKLSRDDLQKLYIPSQEVSNICPAATANSDSPDRIKLVFFESGKTDPREMTLRKTSCERWHLIGGWSKFATDCKFSEGDEISFFEYTCRNGAKFLAIGPRRQPFYYFV